MAEENSGSAAVSAEAAPESTTAVRNSPKEANQMWCAEASGAVVGLILTRRSVSVGNTEVFTAETVTAYPVWAETVALAHWCVVGSCSFANEALSAGERCCAARPVREAPEGWLNVDASSEESAAERESAVSSTQ